MGQKGIISLTAQQYLGYLAIIKESEFVFKWYPDKELIYFEILFSNTSKLVAKIEVREYGKIDTSGVRFLRPLVLFTSEAIEGAITIPEIMRDAVPSRGILPIDRKYFKVY
ncbi:hypothetical protein ACFLZ9_01355 [Patescibacteria group bacterium]